MSPREVLLREIEEASDQFLEEILDFVKFLKQKDRKSRLEVTTASESSLKKDWLQPEEDEAWQHL